MGAEQPLGFRERAKKASNRIFQIGDRLGVHVLPSHYYSSLPSWKALRANEAQWRVPSSMAGIHWDLDEQATWLRKVVGPHPVELPIPKLITDADAVGGLRFGHIESQALYSVVRTQQPRRLVEIGSGSTTLIMSQAVQRNVAEGGVATDILAVDPYTAHKVGGLPHVRSTDAHGISLSVDDLGLEPGDLLFIDTTHAVRTGSEVPHLYLDVLPQLPPGVLVHIHDIYLPFLFTPYLYETYFDWQETTLVAALLVNNDRLQVRAGMIALVHAGAPVLPELFPDFRPPRLDRGLGSTGDTGHVPSSLWLETA